MFRCEIACADCCSSDEGVLIRGAALRFIEKQQEEDDREEAGAGPSSAPQDTVSKTTDKPDGIDAAIEYTETSTTMDRPQPLLSAEEAEGREGHAAGAPAAANLED